MKSYRAKYLSRRSVLASLLATASLPAWAQTIPTNPDVVIIGAGSAGLSAARTLIAQGKSVVIVEGAGRIGGRAYTESDTFGVPYDHGCFNVMGPRKFAHRSSSVMLSKATKQASMTVRERVQRGRSTFSSSRNTLGKLTTKYMA